MAPLWLLPLLEIRCFVYKSQCQHLKMRSGRFYPIDDLEKWGLISRGVLCKGPPDEGEEYIGWTLTEKGRIYVDAVTSVPHPVATWRVPGHE